MITTLKLWLSTIKSVLTNISALVVLAIIYALLVVSSYFFIATREATVWQVFVTYALMIFIPAEFFLFNAAIVDHTRAERFYWRAIVIDALKFFIVTIPVLLIAWLFYYLLNKIGGRYAAPVVAPPLTATAAKAQPVHWPTLVLATLRFVLWGIATPLVLIHLWLAVSGSEFRRWIRDFVQSMGSAFARAFAFESVLIYALGLIIFFVLPYSVLFVPFSPTGNKADFAVFILRLLLTFAFSLIGWIITISALARRNSETTRAVEVAMAQPVEARA